ncbi:UNVERIFIED_CONTAM: hypothetical protein FKN15_020109 [Acipenser sinensis]
MAPVKNRGRSVPGKAADGKDTVDYSSPDDAALKVLVYRHVSGQEKKHKQQTKLIRDRLPAELRNCGLLKRSCHETAGLRSLTKGEFFRSMLEIYRHDEVLGRVIEQAVSEYNIKELMDNYCLEILSSSSESPEDISHAQKIATVVTDRYALTLERYLNSLYKNFINWYLLVGVVPYAFIAVADLYSDRAPRYTETASSEILMVDTDAVVLARRKETQVMDSLRRATALAARNPILENEDGLLHVLREIRLPQSLLETLEPVVRGWVAGRNGCGEARPTALFDLLAYLRQLQLGFVPFVPDLDGGVELLYDEALNAAVGGDVHFRHYEALIVDAIPSDSSPLTAGTRGLEASRLFRLTAHECFRSCLSSTQRVVVTTRSDNAAGPKPSESTTKPQRTEDLLLHLLSAQQPGPGADAFDKTAAAASIFQTHAGGTQSWSGTDSLNLITTKDILEERKNSVLKESFDILQRDSRSKNEALRALRLLNEGNAAGAVQACARIADERDRKVVSAAVANRQRNAGEDDLGRDAMLRLVEAEANLKMLYAFDSRANVGMVEELFYIWSAFWKSAVTGINHLFGQKFIQYTGARGPAGEAIRPFKRLLSDWLFLLNLSGPLLPVVSTRAAPTNGVDESIRVSATLRPSAACLYLAKRMGTRSVDIDIRKVISPSPPHAAPKKDNGDTFCTTPQMF